MTRVSRRKAATSVADRVKSGYTVDTTTGCHLWTGSTNLGYGRFKFAGKSYLAHRVAWELVHGCIPKGMHVDHVCRNRRCCNPAHLRVVTPRQNVLENSEGLAAANAQKTHCPHGHEYSTENTINCGGRRHCKTCHREYERQRRQMLKELRNGHGAR